MISRQRPRARPGSPPPAAPAPGPDGRGSGAAGRRSRTAARRSPARTASRPARTGRPAGPPTGRCARSAPAPGTPASRRSRLWWVNSGRSSANDVASAKSTRHGAPSPETTMLAGVMSRCITPRRCIPATARASATASPISSSTASGVASPARLVVAGVGQHDRVRVPRRVHQLRDPVDPAQPLQHRPLVPQPAVRVRPQRLLADHRAPGKEQPSHPRVIALVDRFRPIGRSRPGNPRPAPIRTSTGGRTWLASASTYIYSGTGDPPDAASSSGARHDRRPGATGAADLRIRDVTGLS